MTLNAPKREGTKAVAADPTIEQHSPVTKERAIEWRYCGDGYLARVNTVPSQDGGDEVFVGITNSCGGRRRHMNLFLPLDVARELRDAITEALDG